MQYYVYLSQGKIDMLYPQVPRSIVKQVALEVGIRVAWFSTTLKTLDRDVALAVKARAVAAHIRKTEQVTTAAGAGPYLFDRLPLKWGVLPDRKEGLSFFGNTFGGHRLVLIGHSHSLVGGGARNGGEITSLDHYVLEFLRGRIEPEMPAKHEFDEEFYSIALNATANAVHDVPQPPQLLEFLARKLHDLEGPQGRIIIASPIYVSLA